MNLKIENTILTGCSTYPNEITEKISIPEEVQKICHHTFFYFQNLKAVRLPSNLKSIEYGAFGNCEMLKNIQFPDTLEYIGHMAFLFCKSLEKLYLPEHVKHIGYGAFAGCANLKEIRVSEQNPCFTAIDNVLYDKGITELYCCPAGIEKIRIPETVRKIRKFAFYGCQHLTEIQIPPSVEYIQTGAFRDCQNLKEILIPATVLQCENPDFPPDTLVSVQGKSGVMTYRPCEAHDNETASCLVLEKDFSIRLEKKIKYDLIFRMFFAGLFGADDYVRKNFSKMFRFLIDNDDTEKIRNLLELKNNISKRNIDSFLRYADENQHSDCWEILYNYKNNKLI